MWLRRYYRSWLWFAIAFVVALLLAVVDSIG